MTKSLGAENDPHLLLSARIGDHPKLIALASDKARWGWIIILAAAKLQRPAGRFANLDVLKHLAPAYYQFVSSYNLGGLLHGSADLCQACKDDIGEQPAGTVVVHDWKRHQERRSRTTEWRQDRGLSNGHQTLGETDGKRNPDVSPGNTGTGALSQSPSPSLSTYSGGGSGEPDDDDPLDVYWRLSGTFPSGAAKDWLTKLGNEFGGKATGNALALEFTTGERGTVLKRTQNRLRFEKDKHERKAVAKAEEREAERIAKSEVTPEQAAEQRRILGEWLGSGVKPA